jgi:hypothetical protein
VNVALVVLWSVLGFVVLRFGAERYFGDPRRASVAAGVVVIAFALGALWQHSARVETPGAATAVAAPSANEEGLPMASNGSDTKALCTSSSLGAEAVSGHVDLVGVVRRGRALPQSSPLALATGDDVVFMGWAADDHVAAPARAACLVVDGKIFHDARTLYRLPRADLVKGYNNPSVAEAGFQIVLPGGRLASGRHRLAVAVVTSGGRVGSVPQQFDVTVR